MYGNSPRGYQHVQHHDDHDYDYDEPHDLYSYHNNNNTYDAGDLGVSSSSPAQAQGLPAPHLLPGSSYPAPPRAALAGEPASVIANAPPPRPPSVTSSSGARSYQTAGAASSAQQRHHHHNSNSRAAPSSPSVGYAPSSSHSHRSHPHAALGGGPAPSETSSAARRGPRHSLPPPSSYAYASPAPQQQYSYAGGADPYAMPTYLYSPTPLSAGPPSVSSGASGSGSTRYDPSSHHHHQAQGNLFAVSAPHHSQMRPQYHHPHQSDPYGMSGSGGGGGGSAVHSRRSLPAGYGAGIGGAGANGMTPGDALPAFPPWSMAWYAGHVSADGHAYTTVPPNGSGAGDWESDTLTSSGAGFPRGHFRPYPPPRADAAYGYGPGSPHHADPPLDPEAQAAARKAARLRALEREFGLKVDGRDPHRSGPHTGEDDDDDIDDEDDAHLLEKGGRGDEPSPEDEDANLPPGSISSEGKFVRRHPKMYGAAGCALLLLCLLAFAIGAGGAFLLKIPPNVPPTSAPAKGTIGSYLLYVLSFLALALSFYLFAIRPCCVEPMRRRKINNATLLMGGAGGAGFGGMMMPIMAGGMMGGGKGGKMPKGMGMPMGAGGRGGGRRGFFGRKKGGGAMMAAPTVNLIVDPRMMLGAAGAGPGGNRAGLDDDTDDSSDEEQAAQQTQLEKEGLAGSENADLAGLIGGRLGAAAGAGDDADGTNNDERKLRAPLTKKQRRRARRAARLRAANAASRRALFLPLVLSSLRMQALWLSVQSLLWLLAVIACLVPLFRTTTSIDAVFLDPATNTTRPGTLNVTRSALGAACSPRGGEGWCDAYNGARASAVIALVVCGGMTVWAMQELGQAKKMARREGAGFRVR
ncbi:hypothetical protein V8E36_003463 [Tilletia maclaganii]